MSITTNKPNQLVKERIVPGKLGTAGLVVTVTTAVANLVLFTVAKSLFGLALLMPSPDSVTMSPLAAGHVMLSSAIPAIGATLLLVTLNRFVARPLRVFHVISAVFLLLSMGGPLSLPVDTATMVVLSLMHIVSAAVIVGGLTLLSQEK